MTIKAKELAGITCIAQTYIKSRKYRDFDYLLEKITEIAKLACSQPWTDEENILIDKMPF